GPPRKTLYPLENVVGNRHCCLHTDSITAHPPRKQAIKRTVTSDEWQAKLRLVTCHSCHSSLIFERSHYLCLLVSPSAIFSCGDLWGKLPRLHSLPLSLRFASAP